MFKRIYVHNFRCLENFELPVGDKSSALLIGKNGAGKSTVSFALALLQKLARGTNRVGQLVKLKDFYLGRSDAPRRVEVDVDLDGLLYQEVGHYIHALRRSFESGGGQVLLTSHNSETIRRFSDENTMVLLRESHLEPTRVKTLAELGIKGDLINTLLRGGVGT